MLPFCRWVNLFLTRPVRRPIISAIIIKDENKLIARTPEKFREGGIDVQLNAEVVNINPKENVVEIKDDRHFPYDILVMATGTSAIVPDMPGIDLPGVFSLQKSRRCHSY